MISDQELEAILATPVSEVEAMIPISGALELDADWTLQQVLDAGLYAEPNVDRLVVIGRGLRSPLVTTVGDLRSSRLPMSWFGLLGESLQRAVVSLAVPGHLSLGELCSIAGAETEISWFLVVDDNGKPTGALSREALERSIPIPDGAEGESCLGYRGVTFGLFAPPGRGLVHCFWCPSPECICLYLSWEIQKGADGRPTCPLGHEVTRRPA